MSSDDIKRAKCVMVLGTSSGAGKSWLTTALCRYYARLGLKVAPFKAQNMSNNARVVASTTGLGEIGAAQYFQALAARAVPEVRMNPLLLKPEADTHSQVVLLGEVNNTLTAMSWRDRSSKVWPAIAKSLDELRAENDVVVIEGAGSPAEINLMDKDIVNLRVARHAEARCLLVTDIDRGGAFAHLYGTWALMPREDQARLAGFVLNKFRGDASMLAPGSEHLEALTGVPTVATLPMWWQHGLPEEDGVFDSRSTARDSKTKTITIAVIAYPRISNVDEFQVLKNIPGVRLVWARSVTEVFAADWIILPGSKNTTNDLLWMRIQGLDAAIIKHALRGGRVLGICGGMQMLGENLRDPYGVEGSSHGLGLLPLTTVFEKKKFVAHTSIQLRGLRGDWAALNQAHVSGYEIHNGQTRIDVDFDATVPAFELIPQLAWQNRTGNVLGLYLHGLFESAEAVKALFGIRAPTLDSVFDGLADYVDEHFDAGVLRGLIDFEESRSK